MKKIILFFAVTLFSVLSLRAQTEQTVHRIGIFVPLYLDSAFDANNEYRYAKNTLPKFINPGLEFYEGAQLAIDSMSKEGLPLEIFIYDTRSSDLSIHDQLAKSLADSVHLIIVHCSPQEVKLFAEEGLKRNIPVINANLPNDGGVTGNPFFVVLNSTLRTQCEGIYKYIQKYYSLSEIVMFRKKGQLEDLIKSNFVEFTKSTSAIPLKIKYVDLIDSFTISQVRAQLDSNKQTLCIAGTMDDGFGKRLTQYLSILKKQYPVTVMGMPTWDAINFTKPEFKSVEILYSTPFYNAKVDKVSLAITSYFNNRMYARPSDMVFRGYETTMRYARLLVQYGQDIASNLGSKQHKIFTDFDIQPVFGKQSMTLDYFENKRLYFIKWQDGFIKNVNY